jgi:hypothetical protein
MVRDHNLTDKVLEEFLKAKLDEVATPTLTTSYSNFSRRRFIGGVSSSYFRY